FDLYFEPPFEQHRSDALVRRAGRSRSAPTVRRVGNADKPPWNRGVGDVLRPPPVGFPWGRRANARRGAKVSVTTHLSIQCLDRVCCLTGIAATVLALRERIPLARMRAGK